MHVLARLLGFLPALLSAQASDSLARPTTDSTARPVAARAVTPLPGAILPGKRVIAFYGNPLSRRMGVLGEYPPDEMLAMLDAEVAAWEAADPATPVQPALHLIAVVARELPGPDGKYRGRMADTLIDRVVQWAETRNAIVFLDFQVGYSTLQEELPRYERFLARPGIHVGIDPEFAMKNGGIPGRHMGTMDAEDVNFAVRYLAGLVRRHELPPKILVVHRFTRRGVTNADQIRLDPAVQIVMHMDGFGTPTLKRATFRQYIQPEPVQFVGWKQFYKARNDNPRTTIEEILALRPKVVYVQYQ
ncbi:MAG: hypothetical protein WD771_07540 [Gemmatimonadaceae bacterium]